MRKLNCICCNREMDNIMGDEGHQPVDGMSFHSYGHYGTTFFDPMDGSFIQIAVCDGCLESANALCLVKRNSPSKESENLRMVEEAQQFIIESLTERVDGLLSDLDSAIEVAWKRGATEWVRMNYPKHYERFTYGKD